MSWRVGSKVPLNVYENDRIMFQCHTPGDAVRVIAILNSAGKLAEALIKAKHTLENWERERPGDYLNTLASVDAALAQYTAGEMEDPKGNAE